MCRSKSAAVAVGARSSLNSEALFTRQVSVTPGARHLPISASVCRAEERSAFTAIALPPAARMAATVSRAPMAESLWCTKTKKPSAASAMASARPIRTPAPVTNAPFMLRHPPLVTERGGGSSMRP